MKYIIKRWDILDKKSINENDQLSLKIEITTDSGNRGQARLLVDYPDHYHEKTKKEVLDLIFDQQEVKIKKIVQSLLKEEGDIQGSEYFPVKDLTLP